jgi:hypothetical protein
MIECMSLVQNCDCANKQSFTNDDTRRLAQVNIEQPVDQCVCSNLKMALGSPYGCEADYSVRR